MSARIVWGESTLVGGGWGGEPLGEGDGADAVAGEVGGEIVCAVEVEVVYVAVVGVVGEGEVLVVGGEGVGGEGGHVFAEGGWGYPAVVLVEGGEEEDGGDVAGAADVDGGACGAVDGGAVVLYPLPGIGVPAALGGCPRIPFYAPIYFRLVKIGVRHICISELIVSEVTWFARFHQIPKIWRKQGQIEIRIAGVAFPICILKIIVVEA